MMFLKNEVCHMMLHDKQSDGLGLASKGPRSVETITR